MKSVKDIQDMTTEKLEAISFDERIPVPENLSLKIHARIAARRRKVHPIVGAAAVVLMVAGLSISLREDEPKDTFDNPYLAYAELEKALSIVSDGMKKGMDMVETSGNIIEKSTEIFK